MTKNEQWLRGWLVTIVMVHFAISLWHGAAHMQLPVPLSVAQSAYVGIVITLMPFVGAAMLWTTRTRDAALIIAASMLGSLIFGVVYHFVLISPDNVMEIPEHEWRHSFVLSSVLLAIIETIGTVVGGFATQAWWHSRPIDHA